MVWQTNWISGIKSYGHVSAKNTTFEAGILSG